jgi:NADH dehydrogenase [ubiquinone] 1 alpha subcomplex assembly factor 7
MPKNPLSELIQARIEKNGPMSLAEYMQLALTHPDYGYYTRKDPLGASGDFITAPEISQIFGELIGLWLAEQWRIMGKEKSLLVELGPGRGTLMSDILRATKSVPGFHDAIDIHLVEASPVLKQKQWKTLADKHPRIYWHKEFSEIPAAPLLLVANEFFDALPIRQFVCEEGEWKEKCVDIVDGKLTFALSPLPLREGLGGGVVQHAQTSRSALPPTLPSPSRGEGISEYCELAEILTRDIAERIQTHGGAALIIDYGYENAAGDTLQAVRNHQYHDVLAEPGTADITAHVDFSLLQRAAKNADSHGPVPQGVFLIKLGAELRATQLCERATAKQKVTILTGLTRLTALEQMGDLFKVLAITARNHPKPEGF